MIVTHCVKRAAGEGGFAVTREAWVQKNAYDRRGCRDDLTCVRAASHQMGLTW